MGPSNEKRPTIHDRTGALRKERAASKALAKPDTQVQAAALINFSERACLAGGLGLGSRQQAFALHFFPGQLARAAHGFRLFAGALFRWLFVMATQFHFAEDTFALHFLLQGFERLIDIVITDENLHVVVPLAI